MNRERMTEVMAMAYWEEDGFNWMDVHPATREAILDRMSKALDAILPQVTTIEALADLPVGTLLKGDDGDVWLRYSTGFDCLSEAGEGGAYSLSKTWDRGPLTVLWRPE